MSWRDDSMRHEGFATAVFADGMHAAGSSLGKIYLSTPDGNAVYDEKTEEFAWRPPSMIVGWKVICECTADSENGNTTYTVLDQLWTRVYNPADEDLRAYRIYAGPPDDEEAEYAPERPDVEKLMHEQWRAHVRPDAHAGILSNLHTEVQDAIARLNDAVQLARRDGLSWAQIGRATRMSRQSARERWGH